jgi:hypothetical protein
MRQRWRMQVHGKQRKEVNKGLLVQALLMLARQLEEAAKADSQGRSDTEPKEADDGSSQEAS